MTPRLAAIAVVVRAGQVLLARRKNEPDAGLWGFPGGHVDFGETALDAAARELREETSVIAEPQKYLTNIDVITRNAEGQITYHFLLAAVLCEYRSGTPHPSDDVSEARWFDFSAIQNLPTSANVAEVVNLAANAYSTTPTIGPS
ncbi:NUDIX hydrolase [Loktanella sp. S4079]|uniref:NUDIX hydrolase n=1 Tax=Loktanella sp. S4079 TaxID=579483 RepID=UPI0005FA1A3E|nr:NUDIX hydrolase [Loktanella sp. S4079]KJZ19224.1 NUDIX hydrolase [Loktanella sp. S4079]